MSVFTATNGMTVERDHNNDVVVDTISVLMADGTALASREFFQHERDEELGRWRWPENPDWVGVEGEEQVGMRTVVLVNERTLERFWINYRAMDAAQDASIDKHAARAFFEAHPEQKPWHDAEPGEVWIIREVDAQPTAARACMVNERMQFEPVNNITRHIDVDDPLIADARRIWPEDAS